MIEHDEAVALARRVLTLRRKRRDHLPSDLFGEHAWGLLLALFIADADGQAMTAASAATMAGTSEDIARRWLKVLEQRGLVACAVNCHDGDPLTLTPAGLHGVEACMDDAKQVMGPRSGPERRAVR